MRASRCRCGLSVVEFLGCLTALAGGVVLGTMYLGLDVKEIAYKGLEYVELVGPQKTAELDSAPDDATEAPTDLVDVTPQLGIAPSAAATATTTTAPVSAGGAVASEPAPEAPGVGQTEGASNAIDGGAAQTAPNAGFFSRDDLITDGQRKVLTLAYWDALSKCMQDEVAARTPAVDAEGNWQLFEYLSGRRDGHLKTAAAIAALDSRGVDAHVLAYSEKAEAWHEAGAKLFGRAVDLLTDAPTAQLSGPFAQSWQSAATQHRMESRLLVEKQQAVVSYLSHAYSEAPLGTTATETPAP